NTRCYRDWSSDVCSSDLPDLISVLDVESAEAITTERLRYGQRVAVIAYPCDPIWRTPGGLQLAGPAAFGYDHPYVPVEELHARRSEERRVGNRGEGRVMG